MKLSIIIILFSFSMSLVAQEAFVGGYAIDITRRFVNSDDFPSKKLVLDGLKLNDEFAKEIGKIYMKFKFSHDGDSIVVIKSKFVYLINGYIYEKKERNLILRTIDPNRVSSFEVFSKSEAFSNFGLKAKYGLIKIEYIEDKKPLGGTTHRLITSNDVPFLSGYAIDITRRLVTLDDLKLVLDGFKLNDDFAKEIGNNSMKFKLYPEGDSVIVIKSKFIYLVNGCIYEKKERNLILRTIDPNRVSSFEVFSKNEAFSIFGLKAKYGLIKIEYIKDKKPLGGTTHRLITSNDVPFLSGYANSIYNSGKLKINHQVLRQNQLWSEWNRGFKWYYTTPRRFVSPVNLRWY